MAAPARLRVLWLIKGLGPGGAERLLVHQAATRGDIEYRAAYLVPTKDHLVPALEAHGVPCSCLGSGREADLRWLVGLHRMVRRHQIDVVHIHSPWPAGPARMLLRAMRRSRPRIAYTEHNRWAQYGPLTRAVNRLTFGANELAVAVSSGVRDSMSPRAAGRTRVLVHGIDVERVAARRVDRAAVRAAWGVDDATVVVGTVANYRQEKAYPDLLEAAARVGSSVPVRFVAVGQGPEGARIEALHRELGLGERFLLLGYQPDAVGLMAGFDLFVLASHHEGLPVALMEAQALGLPVVATAVGGVPEAVTDGVHGRLVAPGHPEELATAVEELATDPGLRAAWGAAARAGSSRFDMRAATATLERWYHELVAGGP